MPSLFQFDESSFRAAVDTRVPGLFAIATPDGVLCARRGGCWYSPRGIEAEACAEALTTDERKFVSV